MSAWTESSVEVFCSYSHQDEPLRTRFEPIVQGLTRHQNVKIWHDRQITAGTDWAAEIDKHLNSADIVVLLVSADFLSSRYCYEKEMGSALDRAARNELVIVPIIVRSCDWEDEPFRRFQAIPENGRAITSWQNQDEAWTEVSKALKRTIRLVLSRKIDMMTQAMSAASHLSHEQWQKVQKDAADARLIYAQIMQDATDPQKQREFEESRRQIQEKIVAMADDGVLPKGSKKAADAFNNIDKYIRG